MATIGDCPACGHSWDAHPVAVLAISACAECIYEEDYALRTDMCRAAPPGLENVPASAFLTASASRSPLGLGRVYLYDKAGERQWWGIQYLGWSSSQRARAVEAEVNDALARLTVLAFHSWLKQRLK